MCKARRKPLYTVLKRTTLLPYSMKRRANIPLTISMYICAIEGVLSVSGGIWIKLSKSVVDMPLLHLLRDTSQYHSCFLHVDGKAFNAQYKKYNRRNAGPGKI